jgi:putative two-component system response regulator
MRVLIADDDDVQLDVLGALLEQEGYDVVRARDGEEALRLSQEASPQIAILDWMMPGMDGIEVCRRIRAGSARGYVYVMLLTSRSDRKDIVDGLAAGADDFLSKPFDPAELSVRLSTGRRVLSMETRHVAIFALAKLADSRDPETGLHLERIREYSRTLARRLEVTHPRDLPADFVETIYLTSPLHDIGKVGIPDCVLLKPARLTDEEYEIMKRHATIGAETLDSALQQYPGIEYLRVARDIAWGHHERFDGRGYPRGLAGEAIPLCARIVALADVYDALTCKRVYKSAYSHDIAKRMIVEESGRQFDPEVVEAFVACEEEFVSIKERLSEEKEVPPAPGRGLSLTVARQADDDLEAAA